MTHSPTPWIGLVALAAMFVIPFLPDWLFEGPRTTKRWPRRHICGDCGAPWTKQHTCAPQPATMSPKPLHGELRRLQQPNPNQRALTSRDHDAPSLQTPMGSSQPARATEGRGGE
jgi:hypothetical protein